MCLNIFASLIFILGWAGVFATLCRSKTLPLYMWLSEHVLERLIRWATILEKQHRSDVQLSERLMSLGIIGVSWKPPWNPRIIIALSRIEQFKEALNWASIMPRDAGFLADVSILVRLSIFVCIFTDTFCNIIIFAQYNDGKTENKNDHQSRFDYEYLRLIKINMIIWFSACVAFIFSC